MYTKHSKFNDIAVLKQKLLHLQDDLSTLKKLFFSFCVFILPVSHEEIAFSHNFYIFRCTAVTVGLALQLLVLGLLQWKLQLGI